MSGRKICAVFCFALLLVGVYWEGRVYESVWKNSEQNVVDVSGQQVEVEKKIAYLTFDDGPSILTPKVLEILEKENVRATFFLIGSQITQEEEELLNEMVTRGHLLGVHTYSHKSDEIYSSVEAYVKDANKTAARIYEVTGIRPTIYRFPWGSVNCYVSGICGDVIEEMKAEGYEYYDWNVSAEDSVGKPTKASILKNIKKDFGKYNEPVILMHDSAVNKATVEALPEIIKMLKEEGYSFGTLDERREVCHYSRKTK